MSFLENIDVAPRRTDRKSCAYCDATVPAAAPVSPFWTLCAL